MEEGASGQIAAAEAGAGAAAGETGAAEGSRLNNNKNANNSSLHHHQAFIHLFLSSHKLCHNVCFLHILACDAPDSPAGSTAAAPYQLCCKC